MTEAEKLVQLARSYGIQTSYLDMTKQRREADREALLLVLRAMGAGVEGFGDVDEALKRRKSELQKRTVEPVLVAWDGKLGDRQFDYGYHWVDVQGRRVFVISAPVKAFLPVVSSHRLVHHPGASRHSSSGRRGIFAPVYALHSRRNPLAGDLTDFENLMDWSHSLGGDVVATLPLLAAFLDEPFEPSPYSPASRLFWNEFYIDFTRVTEFEENLEARRLAAARPRKTRYVDYREVMAWKRRVLEELARTFFFDAKPNRLAAFGKFVRENKGVQDYARFRAVTDRQRKGWNAWPAALHRGTIRGADYDEETKKYHLYVQWIMQEQLQALADKASAQNQLLYLDLPLGLHPDSYDIWRNREVFVRGVAGGAPPDPVFTKGQNWGFPPMHPEAMRLNGYEYVIAYLRNHLRFARLLRVDHVMGLHRLYWIPDELTGEKGVYVEYPAEELYAILSVESHRYQAGIVGENLGTVPPEVNTAMRRHHIFGMYVVQYEIMSDPDKPQLPPVPRNCVASINTHDMAPFRAFLDGDDIDDRVDLGFLTDSTARKERKQRRLMRKALKQIRNSQSEFRNVLSFLSGSMASVVLINMEDLWGEVLPQNVPATHKERPNWRRRFRPSIEQIRRMGSAVKELSHVFTNRTRSLSV